MSATKPNVGHTLGATGAIEAIATILTARAGVAPEILGLEQPDPLFHLSLPIGRPARFANGLALSVTLGFGGFDTCLAFEAL